MHRQRQDAPGLTLGGWKRTGAVAEGPRRRLQVNRDLVVNRRPDTALLQELLQLVSALDLDHERVKHVVFFGPAWWQEDLRHACEELAVGLRAAAPGVGHGTE